MSGIPDHRRGDRRRPAARSARRRCRRDEGQPQHFAADRGWRGAGGRPLGPRRGEGSASRRRRWPSRTSALSPTAAATATTIGDTIDAGPTPLVSDVDGDRNARIAPPAPTAPTMTSMARPNRTARSGSRCPARRHRRRTMTRLPGEQVRIIATDLSMAFAADGCRMGSHVRCRASTSRTPGSSSGSTARAAATTRWH